MNAKITETGQEAAEQAVRDLVSTIRNMRVVFCDGNDREIYSCGPFSCQPGETLSVKVPKPEEIVFSPDETFTESGAWVKTRILPF